MSIVTFVSIPDKNNESIKLNYSDILIDFKNNIYNLYIKDNLKRNFVKINDKCLSNILNFEEANCKHTRNNRNNRNNSCNISSLALYEYNIP